MGKIARTIESFQRFLLGAFYRYGYFLACHPFWFLVVPTIVCGALSAGILMMDPESDSEVLYAPMKSRAIKDRDTVERYFPELSGQNFNLFSQNRLVPVGFAIFRSRKRRTIFHEDVLEQIRELRDEITSITVIDKGKNYTYTDLCARSKGACFIDGEFLLGPTFKAALKMGLVKYPIWQVQNQTVNMRRIVGDVTVSEGILEAANSIQLAFPMRRDTPEMERLSLKWELEYLQLIKTVNLSKSEVLVL
ncbi:patched domain-containing protein 3 [Elysia marginata]|uniref:Patched domain-containing protein 3 n=1 Tax=Elysia marginata TaxID=1093978 RepID=A0AAV4ENM3_9GAST|nr:patched domain-containing protein 3 [Elysia marginata]